MVKFIKESKRGIAMPRSKNWINIVVSVDRKRAIVCR
jgi:hypothetical protein